ncbi:alpha/beta fold hydrolase [Alkalinema pantanalense CENA528]|uniref:alpha/beta fold hydrolase n=1 Tax=Alkalinema pantanalense TaxID=1620705 RepID=UPI003D6DF997
MAEFASHQSFPLHVTRSGQGWPILCLHGHPGTGRSMGVFTQHLSQRFCTIAPDLRGYGRSRTRRRFQMEDHLADLIGVLDQYQCDRTVILGWSLGGILAMELALRYPERVSGLILVATAARPWSDHPKVGLLDNVLTGVAGLINWAKPGWDWNITTFGQRSLFRYLVQRHQSTTYQYLAREAVYAYLTTSQPATHALYQAMGRGYNRVPELSKIQCPVLMLMGEQDRHIAAASSRETAKALPNCEWECYDQAAHLLPWETPEVLLNRIDRWLADYPEVTRLT